MGFIFAGALMVNACVGAGIGFMVAVFHATRFHPVILAVLDVLACAVGIFLIGFRMASVSRLWLRPCRMVIRSGCRRVRARIAGLPPHA